MLETIKAVSTIGKLVALCESSATMLTFYRDGSFDAYFDSIETDTRIVVRYHTGHAMFSYVVLGGYDAEKHCWMREGISGRIEFATRRGMSQVKEAYNRLSLSLKGFYPNILSLYRRGDSWGV